MCFVKYGDLLGFRGQDQILPKEYKWLWKKWTLSPLLHRFQIQRLICVWTPSVLRITTTQSRLACIIVTTRAATRYKLSCDHMSWDYLPNAFHVRPVTVPYSHTTVNDLSKNNLNFSIPQVWIFTSECRILQGDFCLEVTSNRSRSNPVLGACKKKSTKQLWSYDKKVRAFIIFNGHLRETVESYSNNCRLHSKRSP